MREAWARWSRRAFALSAAVALAAVIAVGPAGAASPVSTAGTAVAIAAPAPASVQDFTYDSFEADYYLVRGEGGTSHLYTTEKIVARFPDFDQNKGIVRSIPKADSGIGHDTRVMNVSG